MVMPLYDDNPFTQPIKPVMTWCLIALNLGIFLYEAGATQLALERKIDVFSLTPAALVGEVGGRRHRGLAAAKACEAIGRKVANRASLSAMTQVG